MRFHEYGEPADVLNMETVAMPTPGPGRIRIVVHACGLAPADWALCRGLLPGQLPRGIGCDVSGTVDAVGGGVTDGAPGDLVFGTADWAHCSSAGASDRAIMDHWFAVPVGLDLTQAAALPMALDTAYWNLARLGLSADQTILIHGAGSTVGFAAVPGNRLHRRRDRDRRGLGCLPLSPGRTAVLLDRSHPHRALQRRAHAPRTYSRSRGRGGGAGP